MMDKRCIAVPLLAALLAVPALATARDLKSVKIDLSDTGPFFSGPGAEAMNANCTACHSAEMVHTQPALTKAAWAGRGDQDAKGL